MIVNLKKHATIYYVDSTVTISDTHIFEVAPVTVP